MMINISEDMAHKILKIATGYQHELERQISLTTARTPGELARKRNREELAKCADDVRETFLDFINSEEV
jgi:hypothetical protein